MPYLLRGVGAAATAVNAEHHGFHIVIVGQLVQVFAHHLSIDDMPLTHHTLSAAVDNIAIGISLFTMGLFKKVIIADMLSPWVKDYLYIPMGGNRHGEIKKMRNLFISMLIIGLWHGAGWTFIIWGGLHGLFLMINHQWRRLKIQLPNFVNWGMTFLCVVICWVFFRADTLPDAAQYLKCMFGGSTPGQGEAVRGLIYNPYYVVNFMRPLTRTPEEALASLREIRDVAGIPITGIVNNTNLGLETTLSVIERGTLLSDEFASMASVPLICTAVDKELVTARIPGITMYGKNGIFYMKTKRFC